MRLGTWGRHLWKPTSAPWTQERKHASETAATGGAWKHERKKVVTAGLRINRKDNKLEKETKFYKMNEN